MNTSEYTEHQLMSEDLSISMSSSSDRISETSDIASCDNQMNYPQTKPINLPTSSMPGTAPPSSSSSKSILTRSLSQKKILKVVMERQEEQEEEERVGIKVAAEEYGKVKAGNTDTYKKVFRRCQKIIRKSQESTRPKLS